MKKWCMAAGALCALIGISWLLSLAYVSVPARSKPAAAADVEFAGFPLDRPVPVVIDAEPADFGDLDARARRDQALDWLLLAALAQTAMPAADLNRVSFDLPAVRRAYLGPVADFDHGPRRARSIGGGRVLVLVPAAHDAAARVHDLAAAFDEQRKNLGSVPRELVVFEYTLDLGEQAATLVRRAPVSGAALLSSAYGYHEAAITTRAQLDQFLGRTNDLVYAALRDGHLVLGGRRLSPPQYTGLEMEAVAALWQAQREVGRRNAAFEKKWEREAGLATQALNRRADVGAAEVEAARADFGRRQQLDAQQQGIGGGTGFSLDPEFDHAGLASALARFRTSMAARYKGAGQALDAVGLDAAIDGLKTRDSAAYYALLQALRSVGTPAGEFLLDQINGIGMRFTFQHARYDGPLAGTEVGMTLFYTDLLAKLWALDFHGSATRGVVDGFVPLAKTRLSPVFVRELRELGATRLWFGHQDKGIQIGVERGSITFGRNATRVYAASSDSLVPGVESEPNAPSARFLGWWDDHYEEIAATERQYERLNQIVKWSAMLGWLDAAEGMSRLGFLQEVPVAHDRWFPDWAAREPGLRYADWRGVGFFRRGDPRSATEALPLLRSAGFQASGGAWFVSGGVSLPDRNVFRARTGPADAVPETLRRSLVDYGESGNLSEQVKLLSGVTHTLSEEAGQARLVSHARERARLRTADGELVNKDVERVLRRSEGGVAVDTSVAGQPASELRIEPARNGLRIALRSRELDQAQLLALRASRARDMAEALLTDGDVDMVVRLPGDDHVAFALRDSRRWIEFAPEKEPGVTVANGWSGRVAAVDGALRSVQFRMVDGVPALADSAGGGFVLIKDGARPLPVPVTLDASGLQARRGTTDWLESLRNGHADLAATRIAADPALAARTLGSELKVALAQVDDMIVDGRAVAAGEKLAELRRMYGNLPDIQLRQGLALIERGKAARAAEAVDGMAAMPLRDREAFFDEINRRIRNQDRPPPAGLERWADFARLHQLLLTGKLSRGRVEVASAPSGRTIDIALHHDAPLKGAATRIDDPASIHDKDYLLYVQGDLPGMNEVDWNQPLAAALEQLPHGVTPTVLRLDDIPVAQYRPDVIYAPDVAAEGGLVQRRKVPVRAGRVPGRDSQRCDASAPETDGRTCPEQPAPPVYVVLAQG